MRGLPPRSYLRRVLLVPLVELVAVVGAGVTLGACAVGVIPLAVVGVAEWAESWLEIERCRRG